jgi:hypothetical protein
MLVEAVGTVATDGDESPQVVMSTRASEQLKWDHVMAEVTAHLVCAYNNIEVITQSPNLYRLLPSFDLIVHGLFLALVSIDECCQVAWERP